MFESQCWFDWFLLLKYIHMRVVHIVTLTSVIVCTVYAMGVKNNFYNHSIVTYLSKTWNIYKSIWRWHSTDAKHSIRVSERYVNPLFISKAINDLSCIYQLCTMWPEHCLRITIWFDGYTCWIHFLSRCNYFTRVLKLNWYPQSNTCIRE